MDVSWRVLLPCYAAALLNCLHATSIVAGNTLPGLTKRDLYFESILKNDNNHLNFHLSDFGHLFSMPFEVSYKALSAVGSFHFGFHTVL